MVTGIEYASDGGEKRRVDIDRMDECVWRVWLSTPRQTETVFRRSLTSAQSTSREFIRTGKFPSR